MKKQLILQHVWSVLLLLTFTFILSCDPESSETPPTTTGEITPVVIDEGLNRPWGMAFLENNTFIVTERNGGIKYHDGRNIQDITHSFNVQQSGQGGFLDIQVSPNYETDGYIYMTYSKRISSNTSTLALVRFKLNNLQVTDEEELFEAQPYLGGDLHYGSRMTFDQSGHVYVTTGDRYTYSTASAIADVNQAYPQTLNNHWGKVIRLNLDGSIPLDNPFHTVFAALPEVYTYGHRNPQGITYNPNTNQVLVCEHGAQGGDEINLIESGKNYGWPAITYGKDYNNNSIGNGTTQSGMEQPLIYWDPSVAPSSLLFYKGNRYPDWEGAYFMTNLAAEKFIRLSLANTTMTAEEDLYDGAFGRIRYITESPDGLLYFLTDSPNGRVMQLEIQ